MRRLLIFFTIGATAALFLSSCESGTGPKSGKDNNFDVVLDNIDDLPYEEVSPAEASGLAFMREEEKLAHDVYTVLYNKWGQRVFNNISNNESQHMEAIKKLLDKYELADPVGSNGVGVFVDTLLQNLYNNLTAYGDSSLVHALTVGAIIEEVDIRDIQSEVDSTVDNEDIGYVYENLLRGSRNHLRAYVKNLSNNGIIYEPQYLSEELYLEIITSSQEQGF